MVDVRNFYRLLNIPYNIDPDVTVVLNEINRIFQMIQEDMSKVRGLDGLTPEFGNEVDLGGNPIANVAAGEDSTDAATVSQTSVGFVDVSGIPILNDYARFTDANTIQGRDYGEVLADLSLVIGSDILAEQTVGIADDNLLEVDGSPNSGEVAIYTANGLDGKTEGEFKTLFNIEAGVDFQAYDVGLLDIAGLAVTDGNFIVGDGANWVAESGATVRTSLGLGTAALRDAEDSLTDGANLPDGAAIKAYGDVNWGAGSVGTTGSPVLNEFAVFHDATTLKGLDYAAVKTALGLVIDTNIQAWDTQLDDIAALAVTDGNFIVGDGANWTVESGAAVRASLGLGSAALRSAEDSLTDGSNLPDGAAIKAYGDANWGAGAVGTFGSPIDNDFAKFIDANTIEGRSYSEVRNDLGMGTSYSYNATAGALASDANLYNGSAIIAYIAGYVPTTYWTDAGAYINPSTNSELKIYDASDNAHAIFDIIKSVAPSGDRSGSCRFTITRTGGSPQNAFMQEYHVDTAHTSAFDIGMTSIIEGDNVNGGGLFGMWAVAAGPATDTGSWAIIGMEINTFERHQDQGKKTARSGKYSIGLQIVPEDSLNVGDGAEVGYHGSFGLAFAGGNGGTAKWHTGIFFDALSIAPEGTGILMRGGTHAANDPDFILEATGVFNEGIDLTGATFSALLNPAIKIADGATMHFGSNFILSFGDDLRFWDTSNNYVTLSDLVNKVEATGAPTSSQYAKFSTTSNIIQGQSIVDMKNDLGLSTFDGKVVVATLTPGNTDLPNETAVSDYVAAAGTSGFWSDAGTYLYPSTSTEVRIADTGSLTFPGLLVNKGIGGVAITIPATLATKHGAGYFRTKKHAAASTVGMNSFVSEYFIESAVNLEVGMFTLTVAEDMGPPNGSIFALWPVAAGPRPGVDWSGGVIGCEINTFNRWGEDGLKEDRATSNHFYVGIQVAPEDELNVGAGSEVGYHGSFGYVVVGGNAGTAKWHIGYQNELDSIAPLGRCFNIRGGSTVANQPEYAMQFRDKFKYGIDFRQADIDSDAAAGEAIYLKELQRIRLGGSVIYEQNGNLKLYDGITATTYTLAQLAAGGGGVTEGVPFTNGDYVKAGAASTITTVSHNQAADDLKVYFDYGNAVDRNVATTEGQVAVAPAYLPTCQAIIAYGNTNWLGVGSLETSIADGDTAVECIDSTQTITFNINGSEVAVMGPGSDLNISQVSSKGANLTLKSETGYVSVEAASTLYASAAQNIQMTAGATGKLYLNFGGYGETLEASHSAGAYYFLPVQDSRVNLGLPSFRWLNIYGDNIYDAGGLLDDIDDLTVLHGMKAKGNERDSDDIAVLDTHTLPDWMTNKKYVKEQFLNQNGDMVTEEDFNEWIQDDEELGHLLQRNLGRTVDLTAGAVRQLDIRVQQLITRIDKMEGNHERRS